MRRVGGIAFVACLLCWPGTSLAQTVEVTPFVGYRFGGGFFERITGQPVDLDGAPAAGAVVNVRFRERGLFAEALFTRQEARLKFPGGPSPHRRVGGSRSITGRAADFRSSGTSRRARPFVTGLLGLTRYAAEGDNEIRFAVSAGGGVKPMPVRYFGVRLDGRVFATFADIDGRVIGCSPGCARWSSTQTLSGRQSSAPGSSWRSRDARIGDSSRQDLGCVPQVAETDSQPAVTNLRAVPRRAATCQQESRLIARAGRSWYPACSLDNRERSNRRLQRANTEKNRRDVPRGFERKAGRWARRVVEQRSVTSRGVDVVAVRSLRWHRLCSIRSRNHDRWSS